MHATSFSMSSCVHPSCWFRWPCFLGFFIPSGSYILSASSSMGFSKPWGGGIWWGYPVLHWAFQRLTLCTMSDCGSLHLLPSAEVGRFSGDGWARHRSCICFGFILTGKGKTVLWPMYHLRNVFRLQCGQWSQRLKKVKSNSLGTAIAEIPPRTPGQCTRAESSHTDSGWKAYLGSNHS